MKYAFSNEQMRRADAAGLEHAGNRRDGQRELVDGRRHLRDAEGIRPVKRHFPPPLCCE